MKLSKGEIYDMLDNPLVQQVIFDIVGEDMSGFNILAILVDLEQVTDDEISRQLNLKLNNVRKILYKLYEARLVNYDREKDEETSWYIYTWKPALEKLPCIVKKKMEQILEDIKKQLDIEENNIFFYCPGCELKFTFEDAMDSGFRCPHCDERLREYDNRNDIKIIKEQIKFLEDEFKLNPLFSNL